MPPQHRENVNNCRTALRHLQEFIRQQHMRHNHHIFITKRSWLAIAVVAAILAGCSHPAVLQPGIGFGADAQVSPSSPPVPPCTDQASFHLLGETRWGPDVQFAGVPVGGLSSIDYNATDDRYYLVSDDRSAHDSARFYTARIHYDASGLHSVQLDDARHLGAPDDQPYAPKRVARAGVAVPDPEALRVLPGSQRIVWSSEGDFARGFGPELNEATLDGRWQQAWPLPPQLQLPARNSGSIGPRNNMTLEGMAISDDQKTLWLAMEGALKQDGPLPARGVPGGPLRITQYDIATRQPQRQIAYVPDALPVDNLTLPLVAVNGVSEILADGPGHLLVLERSYVLGTGFSARLYRIATDATNTLAMDALVPGQFEPASKTLLLDLAQAGLQTVDNIEGMTWGPRLANGQRVLLLVSDNNFNPAEVTQFIALAETPTCPR